MDERERAYYARFTVHLGSHGNFDYWGDPTDGHVCYVGDPEIGCLTGSWGPRDYWRSMAHYHVSAGTFRTEAGRNW